MPTVLQARQAVMEVYKSSDFGEHQKSDHTPVTRADKASQDIILPMLEKITPEIPVISEEAKLTSRDRHQTTMWLLDPLDGTKEFIRRSGEFTINVGLVREGRPIYGLVDVPAAGETYIGQVGQGAFKIMPDGTREEIRCRPPEASGWAVALSRSHQGDLEHWLASHKVPVSRRVFAGSALKFCWIAEGRADFYVRLLPTMGWDTAAGQALLEASGGRVVTLDGLPLTYHSDRLTNPTFAAMGLLQWP